MDLFILIIQILILLMSVVIHEVSHGAMANYLGDPTAKYQGRLTLNPIKHLDFWGSLIVPLFLLAVGSPVLFGWAKPVPYNPYNLKDQRWGPAKVAAAGPLANLSIALIFGMAIRFIPMQSFAYTQSLIQIFAYIVILNILLAVFNLMPIPPLDGSKILLAILPSRFEHIARSIEKYSIFILLFFIFFIFQLIIPVVFWLFRLITGTSIM
ncbi:MAG: site-2 protease family protein [Candidatus Portnoybacteria bacterium]|nr:site-2 protease family protein [Candidatus Portnoybacteria bacterium]